MKHSRADVCGKARLGLDIRFEAQNLTSYSGLILFQHFFSLIGIKERLWSCFRHLKVRAGPRGLDRDRDLISGIF